MNVDSDSMVQQPQDGTTALATSLANTSMSDSMASSLPTVSSPIPTASARPGLSVHLKQQLQQLEVLANAMYNASDEVNHPSSALHSFH